MPRLDTTTPPFGPRTGAPPKASPQPGPIGDDAHFGPRAGDAQLANAYRDLETAIGDLKCMAALMITAAECTVQRVDGPVAEHIRQCTGFTAYRIHALTENESDGLNYAISHLYDLIQVVHETYYAAFKKQAAS